MIDKHGIKDRVLTENTAQGILNHLRELESNRARMQGRWIWELLQNARDASVNDDTNLVASVEVGDGEVVFRHNGCGFTMEEVAHLIYHGSTKVEDENAIGQYGSGFLTTHLLSPVIDVSGQLTDSTPFEFQLKREISSTKSLSDSMDQAWSDFDSSGELRADVSTTTFRYPIGEDAVGAVEQGIETLRRCAPLVVVFNRQFRRIDIQCRESATWFEVVKRTTLPQESLQTVTVGVSDHGILREQEYLLAEGSRVSVAIPMKRTDDGPVCLALGNIPRLFLGFPLVGTETFSFPAVINSFAFTPTENRDGVYLGQSDDAANRTNQAIVEEAFELHVRLMKFVTESHWAHVYKLADIPPISHQPWLNADWLNERLGELVAQIRQTPTVRNRQACMPPKDCILPLAEESDAVESFWDLLSEVKAFRQRLPQRKEATGWCLAVKSWESIVGCEAAPFEEGYDGTKFGAYLEDATTDSGARVGTLERLQGALRDGIDAAVWLDRLHQCLKADGLDDVSRKRNIVLDQAGYLDELSNLYRDDNVAIGLKYIGDDVLTLGIRGQLRDTRLTSLAGEVGKGLYSNKDAVRQILDKLQELCLQRPLEHKFTEASPRLLAWLVANREWSHLTSYPAFSKMPDDGGCELLRLVQTGGENAAVPLAPVKAWAEDLQRYADLFPWRNIMADEFFAVMPRDDVWKILSDKGYVRTDVVFSDNRSVGDFLPDEPLADGDHKTVDTVAVTDLMLLTRDRVGIMARVRGSQVLARLFWEFLTEWLIVRDPEGVEVGTAKCECGESHRYYPAMWLVPVVKNRWVPQGNDIRDRPSAQSLARLLRGSGWTPSSLGDRSATIRLLEAIRVTRLDLTRHFIVSGEQSRSAMDSAMTDILVSTGGDLSDVREFVEDLKTDKDLHTHLADRRERRRIVNENQRLGDLVEDLVKKGLEDEGFTVRRTGIGSDFEIEYDLIRENEEMGIELSRNDRTWLVEVKATRERSVRMTARQAETAVTEGDGFLLCVVPVERNGADLEVEDVRADMRFVENIGPRVKPLCGDLDVLDDLRDDATAPSGSGIQLEIEAGTARIRVDRTVWQDGVHLDDLCARLTGTNFAAR